MLNQRIVFPPNGPVGAIFIAKAQRPAWHSTMRKRTVTGVGSSIPQYTLLKLRKILASRYELDCGTTPPVEWGSTSAQDRVHQKAPHKKKN